MSTYIYYNSNTDGTFNSVITSGTINAVFDTLPFADRVAGVDDFGKIWIESDTTETLYIGLNQESDYNSCVFVSAAEADAVGDLTGSEARYGQLTVISATTSVIVVTDHTQWTLVRTNDKLIIGGDLYTCTGVTDNLDGTSDLAVATEAGVVSANDIITSAFALSVTAATKKPIWSEEKVLAGSPKLATYTASELLIGV